MKVRFTVDDADKTAILELTRLGIASLAIERVVEIARRQKMKGML